MLAPLAEDEATTRQGDAEALEKLKKAAEYESTSEGDNDKPTTPIDDALARVSAGMVMEDE